MADLLQDKIDLAKIVLYRFLIEKSSGEYTKPESEVAFWLSSDKTIQEALKKIDAPASS